MVMHRSIQDEIIRIRQQVALATRPTPTATDNRRLVIVHVGRLIVVRLRVDALDGIDIVLVHALVHCVTEGDLRRVVAVVVEEDQVDERREERKVQVVREVDKTVAALVERETGQDEDAADGDGETGAEEDEGVAVEGGLHGNQNHIADARVRHQVDGQVDQHEDD